MLSLLKKSDAPPPVQPFWHPDFRHQQKLPDIKAVRTTFWINGPALFVVLALGLYFGLQEWQLRALNIQIADAEARIKRDKKGSEQNVALFKKFETEEARIGEVDAFVKSKPLVSAIILRLSQTLPPNIAIDTMDFRETGLTLRLSVRGDSVAASGYASAYRDRLAADKELAVFEDVAFTSTPVRNPATGRMAVEIFLRLKGAKK
jgi:hypothetical protein